MGKKPRKEGLSSTASANEWGAADRKLNRAGGAGSQSQQSNEASTGVSHDTQIILNKIQEFLDQNRHEDAYELARKHVTSNRSLRNAYGVCQLRLGDFSRAVATFRELVLASNSICTRTDIPLVYKTNFAMALLLSDNISGAINLLNEPDLADDARAIAIREAYRQWKSEMSFWERFKWSFQVKPQHKLTLSFPPGDLH